MHLRPNGCVVPRIEMLINRGKMPLPLIILDGVLKLFLVRYPPQDRNQAIHFFLCVIKRQTHAHDPAFFC